MTLNQWAMIQANLIVELFGCSDKCSKFSRI